MWTIKEREQICVNEIKGRKSFNKVLCILVWKTRFWLVVWVLWHINLRRLFNAKFSLYIYIYIYNLRFLNEYFADNDLDKQDLICLHTINRFLFIIFFGKTLSLSRRTEHHPFWRFQTDRSNYSPWKVAFWWERNLYILWEHV